MQTWYSGVGYVWKDKTTTFFTKTLPLNECDFLKCYKCGFLKCYFFQT